MEGHPGGQRDPAHHRGGGVHQRWHQHQNDAEQREFDDACLSEDDLEYLQAFTVAKRTLEGQDMIYQSVKLTNGIWGLVEIKLSPGNPSITLSFKSRVMEIAPAVFSVYDAILHN